MTDKERELEARVRQLEASIKHQSLFLPPKPDTSLAEDEYWAIFTDYRDSNQGILTKIPWAGGSNRAAVYKVKITKI